MPLFFIDKNARTVMIITVLFGSYFWHFEQEKRSMSKGNHRNERFATRHYLDRFASAGGGITRAPVVDRSSELGTTVAQALERAGREHEEYERAKRIGALQANNGS